MNISTREPERVAGRISIPNMLTWGRILAIPLLIILFYIPSSWSDPLAGMLFALAGITDSLDGYLARKWQQTTRLGAFLDPVADKLIVATALVLLISRPNQPVWDIGFELKSQVVVVLCAIVIIGREIAVSALREWMAEIGARRKVAVTRLAKFKTIMQIVGLSMLLFRWDFWFIQIYELGLVLTVVAAVLTLWSAADYLRMAWPDLTRE